MGKKEQKEKKKLKEVEEDSEQEQQEIVEIKKKKKKEKKSKKIVEEEEEQSDDNIEIEQQKEKKKKSKKDKKRKIASDDEEEEETEEQVEKIEKKVKQPEQNEENQKHEVIIQGLSYESTEEDIKQYFIKTNENNQKTVISTKLLWDSINNRSRGTCFVVLDSKSTLETIITKCHNVNFMGRNIRISDAGLKAKKENPMDQETMKNSKTLRVRNLSFKVDEKQLQKYFQSCGKIEKIRLEKFRGKSRGYGHVDFEERESLDNALKKDGQEILGRKIVLDIGYPEKPKEEYNNDYQNQNYNNNNNTNNNYNNNQEQKQDYQQKPQQESSTIFVGNLNFEVQESDIKAYFEEVGAVEEVRLAKYEDGSLKGFGFVKFESSDKAKDAVQSNGSEFQGRNLIIQLSQDKKRN